MKKIIVSVIFLLFSCDFVEDKSRKNPLDDKVNAELSIGIKSIEGIDSLEFGSEIMLLASDLIDIDSVVYNQFISEYIWTINGSEIIRETDTLLYTFNRLNVNVLKLRGRLTDNEVSLGKEYNIVIFPIIAQFSFMSPIENSIFNFGEEILFEYSLVNKNGVAIVPENIELFSDLDGNFDIVETSFSWDKLRAGEHQITLRVKLEDGNFYTEKKNIEVRSIPVTVELNAPDENLEHNINESIPFDLKILSDGVEIQPISNIWKVDGQELLDGVSSFDLKNYLLTKTNTISYISTLADKQIYSGNTSLNVKFVGDYIDVFGIGELHHFNNKIIRVDNHIINIYDDYEVYEQTVTLKSYFRFPKVNENTFAMTHYTSGNNQGDYLMPTIYVYDENFSKLFSYVVDKTNENGSWVPSVENLSYHHLNYLSRFDGKVGFFMYNREAINLDIVYFYLDETGALISETNVDNYFDSPNDSQKLFENNGVVYANNAFYLHSNDELLKINENGSLGFVKPDDISASNSKLYHNSHSQRIVSIAENGTVTSYDYDGNLIASIMLNSSDLINFKPVFYNDKFIIASNSKVYFMDMNLNTMFSKDLSFYDSPKIKIYNDRIYIIGNIYSKINNHFETKYNGGQIIVYDLTGNVIFNKTMNTRYNESFNDIYFVNNEIIIYGQSTFKDEKTWKIILDQNGNILNFN